MQHKFLRNLKLLLDSPKDFLFSYTYSDKEQVHLKKFNPKAKVAAENLIKKLGKLTPDVKFYLVGSTALEIDGIGDVDIIATTKDDLKKIAEKYANTMGSPDKERRGFIQWNFKHMYFDVEFTLSHPDNRYFQRNVEHCNILKNDPRCLSEYKDLKKRINGYSMKEYTRERMSFFNRILKEGANYR